MAMLGYIMMGSNFCTLELFNFCYCIFHSYPKKKKPKKKKDKKGFLWTILSLPTKWSSTNVTTIDTCPCSTIDAKMQKNK